jgi:acetyl-CoA C-acetyltransferase
MANLNESRIPVIVAGGHSIRRDGIFSPLDLAAFAAEAAFEEAPALRERVEQLSLVNVLARVGSAPATTLARRLGLEQVRAETTTIGGNTPQTLVNRAARAIAAGELQAALLVGGEAQRSAKERRAARSEAKAGSSAAPTSSAGAGAPSEAGTLEDLPPDPVFGDDRPGIGPAEMAANLIVPVHIYPLFESVIAWRAGRSFAEQRAFLGKLMARFAEVAAKHPFAWFPEPASPEELSELSESNRLVAEPYPKRMCAFLNVDQGAAVIVCSLEAARAAGVADRAVFCWSGAEASDVWFPVERPDPGRSPAIEAAAASALQAAGKGVDDMAAFDLYSCFPCAVEMGAEAMGLSLDDPRGFTVTGGLPYFGGPGNNYTMHAIATMTDRLRDQGGLGLVTGLGWYATKHSVGIYGADPPPSGFAMGDTTDAQARIDASAMPVAEGLGEEDPSEAIVVASTIVHGPDGAPSGAPVIARLADGRHVAAALAEGEDGAGLAGRNLVGEQVVVSGSPPRYRLA